MESNSIKRKKRKTRKCLDELRKRSRQNPNDSSNRSPKSKQNEFSSLTDTKQCNYNSITSTRLTLSLYPKFVRSETITRPALLEIGKNQLINLNNIMKDKRPVCTVTSNNINLPNDLVSAIKNDHNTTALKTVEKSISSNIKDNLSNEEHSSTSVILFSSEKSEEDNNGNPQDDHVSSTPSTLSSTSSLGAYNYREYDDFMKEVPLYLKKNIPVIFREDIMKKTKAKLHSIYVESCQKECEDNVWQCIANDLLPKKLNYNCMATERIVENPIDYLRLGYSWRPDYVHGLDASLVSNPISQSLPHSEETHHFQVTTSPMETTPHSSPSSEVHAVLHDTPDYSFFPHKLN